MKKLFLKPILLIIIAAFIVRLVNLNFPFFTPDEARIAARGYTIATSGKDELGRFFPLVFNSSTDYQLPVVSYITALGVFIFGRTELGARIPFILISILIVLLVYKIADIFNIKEEYRLLAAFIAAFTPALIFLSKIPNETIVLTFSLLLLFYLLTKKTVNFFILIVVIFFTLTISKIAWLVLLPFISSTLIFFQKSLSKSIKTKIIYLALILVVITVSLFIAVPQSGRSFMENNFQILQDGGTRVVLNRFRGEGLKAGWPNLFEKILFNKFQIISAGFMSWLSHLEPSVLFSQFDEEGIQGFSNMGVFSKMVFLPFLVGFLYIIRKKDYKLGKLIFYLLFLTFPVFFMYPAGNKSMIAIAVPYLILIVVLGFNYLTTVIKVICMALIILEVVINISFVSPEIKNANQARPVWIKSVMEDSYNLSLSNKVAISDDLVSDVSPYLSWLSPKPIKSNVKDVKFPYKFRETEFPNIKIIGTDDEFYKCEFNNQAYIFASNRDLAKAQKWWIFETGTIKKIYEDTLNTKKAYLLKSITCPK